jgi:hypothetical protein
LISFREIRLDQILDPLVPSTSRNLASFSSQASGPYLLTANGDRLPEWM